MADDKKPEARKQAVRIDFTFPDDIQSYFVSNAIVQHQPEYFTLSFFEAWLPLVLSPTNEDGESNPDELPSVSARCVARLVMTPGKMREIVAALNENLKKYDQLMESIKSLEEEE